VEAESRVDKECLIGGDYGHIPWDITVEVEREL